jgi:predicted flavoprotein YhiN
VNRIYDVIVLGAGAAGLMCAMEAGKRGRSVLVLERSDRAGRKILISGGGRCNFTNLHAGPENFLSSNPHFAKSALARYTPADFIRLVEKHRIPYHEKKLGQLFCDRAASDITTMLEQECRGAGVEVQLNTQVVTVRKDSVRNLFLVQIAGPDVEAPKREASTNEVPMRVALKAEAPAIEAHHLVVATGGLSIAKIGATGFGYELARQFGLNIETTRPALVPLALNRSDRRRWCDLAGVSLPVTASVPGPAKAPIFRENMLVTHQGFSGPAILQASSYWACGGSISLDLAPGRHLIDELPMQSPRGAGDWKALLRQVLPRRFADRWLETYPLGGTSNRDLAAAEQQLHAWEVKPEATEGYGKAEVTAGGVSTGELSARTMESRKVPGLFFVGEVVDVTGQLGGFNFQWAWASGFCCGQVV